MSYLPELQAIYVDFGFLSGNEFKCTWYNPDTGMTEKEFRITQKTVQRISPAHGEDWVLMIRED